MAENIKGKSLATSTAKSFLWVAIDSLGQRMLQFFIGIILARILLPEEFGLIGLIAIFLAFSMVFIDSGFSFALIRKKVIHTIEYTTVFWFNLAISILFYIALFFASPFIAIFYEQPILESIIKVVGLNLIINAIGSTQGVMLRHSLLFKQLTIIGFAAKIISGSVALIMAFNGFGVWALVYQQLILNVVRVTLMIYFNWFLPKLIFSIACFKSLFSFSYKLIFGGISHAISSNIYPLVIGKVFSIDEVGFFNRAIGLRNLPVLLFTNIIQQVTLPSFSQIQDEDARFVNTYKKSIRSALFIVLLPLIIIILTAKPLIIVLLTSKWEPAAYMLQIICLGSIFYPATALNVNILGIKGRSDYVMISQFIKDAFVYIGLAVGLLFGIDGLLWSMVITGNFSFLLHVYFTAKVVDYPITNQLKDIGPVLLLSIVTVSIVAGVSLFLTGSNLFLIIIKSILITSIYLGLAYLLKFQELETTIQMFGKMLRKSK